MSLANFQDAPKNLSTEPHGSVNEKFITPSGVASTFGRCKAETSCPPITRSLSSGRSQGSGMDVSVQQTKAVILEILKRLKEQDLQIEGIVPSVDGWLATGDIKKYDGKVQVHFSFSVVK